MLTAVVVVVLCWLGQMVEVTELGFLTAMWIIGFQNNSDQVVRISYLNEGGLSFCNECQNWVAAKEPDMQRAGCLIGRNIPKSKVDEWPTRIPLNLHIQKKKKS